MSESRDMKLQKILVITDGKAGDEMPCLAVADGLGARAYSVVITPKAPWTWMMPWGAPDPCDWKRLELIHRVNAEGIDAVIATGRRAVPYLRKLRRLRPDLFTIFLKDPRVGPDLADVIWLPEHDKLRAPNVLSTVTGPHRFRPEALAARRAEPPQAFQDLQRRKVAVLVGGNSLHFSFSPACVTRLINQLDRLVETDVSLMISTSRRTPAALVQKLLSHYGDDKRHLVWTSQGDNPYFDYLAFADGVVVTADSANMMGEAAVTGRPVLVFWPKGKSLKMQRQFQSLSELGIAETFAGHLPDRSYTPLDALPAIVEFIDRLYRQRWTG